MHSVEGKMRERYYHAWSQALSEGRTVECHYLPRIQNPVIEGNLPKSNLEAKEVGLRRVLTEENASVLF